MVSRVPAGRNPGFNLSLNPGLGGAPPSYTHLHSLPWSPRRPSPWRECCCCGGWGRGRARGRGPWRGCCWAAPPWCDGSRGAEPRRPAGCSKRPGDQHTREGRSPASQSFTNTPTTSSVSVFNLSFSNCGASLSGLFHSDFL